MTKRRGRREHDDERLVYLGAQAKADKPSLKGFPLAREAYRLADIDGPSRQDLDRVSKKIVRRIARGDVPATDPIDDDFIAFAEGHLDAEAEKDTTIPELIDRVEARLRELGFNFDVDPEMARQHMKLDLGRLNALVDGPPAGRLEGLMALGAKTKAEIREMAAKARAERDRTQALLEAVNQLIDLRYGRIPDSLRDDGVE